MNTMNYSDFSTKTVYTYVGILSYLCITEGIINTLY